MSASRVLGADAKAALTRFEAGLRLCCGQADAADALSASDRCRANALAACSLAPHDVSRAAALLDDAVGRSDSLADGDPGVRTLAAQANTPRRERAFG